VNQQKFVSYDVAESVTRAIETRRSLRAFQKTPVPEKLISQILESAARAPSGVNMQPWQVYVLTGKTRDALCTAVCEEFDNPDFKPEPEVSYYPSKWFEPYVSRRRQVGWDLYGLLDIKKGDREKTHQQHRRNYQFFDAPTGLMFTIHKDLATGSWLDYGMFLENIMLLAREAGLHSCPQAAWPDYHQAIRKVLPLSDDEVVVCGMAIGFADTSAIENTLVTERVPLDSFVSFLD